MNITFIIDTFIKAFYGVPVTLGIMIVAILLSFLPALFLALGQIYMVRGVKTFSIVYLAFIRAIAVISFIVITKTSDVPFTILITKLHKFGRAALSACGKTILR